MVRSKVSNQSYEMLQKNVYFTYIYTGFISIIQDIIGFYRQNIAHGSATARDEKCIIPCISGRN